MPNEEIFHTKYIHSGRYSTGGISMFVSLITILLLIFGETKEGPAPIWGGYIIPPIMAFPLFIGILTLLAITNYTEITIFTDRIELKGTDISLAVDKESNPISFISILRKSLGREKYVLYFDDIEIVVPDYVYGTLPRLQISFFEIKMKNGDSFSVIFKEDENPLSPLKNHVTTLDIEEAGKKEIREHLIENEPHIPRYIFSKAAATHLKQPEFDDRSVIFLFQIIATIVITGTVFAVLCWFFDLSNSDSIMPLFLLFGIDSVVFLFGSVSMYYHGRWIPVITGHTIDLIVWEEQNRNERIFTDEFLGTDEKIKNAVDERREERFINFH